MNFFKYVRCAAYICILCMLMGCAAKADGDAAYAIKDMDSAYSWKQVAMFHGQIGWGLSDANEVCYTSDGISAFSDVKKLEGIHADSDGFVHAAFLDPDTAYVTYFDEDGQTIAVSYTMDAAKTWETTRISYKDYAKWGGANAAYISFADAKNGWLLYCSDPAAGQMEKLLFQTTDGGNSFTFLADISEAISGYPSGISFSSAQDGYIAVSYHGETDVLYQTEDAGTSWKKMDIEKYAEAGANSYADAFPPVFYGEGDRQGILLLKYVSDHTFYVAYTTEDGGKTWDIGNKVNCDGFLSLSLDDGMGYLVDGTGTIKGFSF